MVPVTKKFDLQGQVDKQTTQQCEGFQQNVTKKDIYELQKNNMIQNNTASDGLEVEDLAKSRADGGGRENPESVSSIPT